MCCPAYFLLIKSKRDYKKIPFCLLTPNTVDFFIVWYYNSYTESVQYKSARLRI